MKHSQEIYYPNPLDTGLLDARQYQKWLREKEAPHNVVEEFFMQGQEALETLEKRYTSLLSRLDDKNMSERDKTINPYL